MGVYCVSWVKHAVTCITLSFFNLKSQINIQVNLILNPCNYSASEFCFMSNTSFRTLVEQGPGAAVIRHVQPSASSLELYSSLAGLVEFSTAEFSVFFPLLIQIQLIKVLILIFSAFAICLSPFFCVMPSLAQCVFSVLTQNQVRLVL